MKRLLYSRDEIALQYNVNAVVCANGWVQMRQYDRPLKYLPEGWEIEPETGGKSNAVLQHHELDDEPKEIERRSLNKTKYKLIEYASENINLWHSFITLTFKENETNITDANDYFHKFCTKWKRKKHDFAYIAMPEYQKRGAVHYHMITNLQPDIDIPKRKPIKTWNPEKFKWFILTYYDVPFWTNSKRESLGFSSALPLDMTDSNFNVALYMCKYLFKEVDNRLYGRKKLLKSNNLKEPDKIRLQSNVVYQKAMQYLIDKGYEPDTYRNEKKGQYDMAFDQFQIFIKNEHIEEFMNLINEERKK